jgi:glycosyltransferase involved in cell wall biosynthesis
MLALKRPARRVLLVARWPVGGIRTHLGYNWPALAEAGCQFTLVVPDDNSLSPLREKLTAGSPRFVPVPTRGKACPLWRTVMARLASERFDLVHAHGMIAAANATLGGLLSRVPLLVTLHEPVRDAQFAGVTGMMKRWALGHALARAAAIVTVSNDARDNLLSYFPNLRRRRERIHTIPNGIDTSPGPDAEPRLRAELGIDAGTLLVGYLGRFMPEKGFPLLLEAVERIVKAGGTRPFHVAAFGSSDYHRQYQQWIDDRSLRRWITLCNFVPDVRPVLRQMELVVIPSLWEASPLVPLEAMCAGVPVLGADCPGLREALAGTPSRMFSTGDVAALESSLRQAIARPWADAARRFAPLARERFDNGPAAARLISIYTTLRREARR